MSNFIWAIGSACMAVLCFVMAGLGNVWVWYVGGGLWAIVAIGRLYLWITE